MIKEFLEKKITEAATAYYTGQSIMSDSEFDSLIEQLRDVDPDNKLLSTPGWGYVPTLNKSNHLYGNVGSLSKYRFIESLANALNEDNKYVITPKFDGISCVVYYENSKLLKAVTRGNGIEGTDVTDKFLEITRKSKLDTPSRGVIGIRGEFVISDDNFNIMKIDYPEYKNSRNAVAGIINSKEMSKCLKFIDFAPYKFQGAPVTMNNDFTSIMKFLHKEFSTAALPTYVNSKEELDLEVLKEAYSKRNNYPCDGVVINSNRFEVLKDGTYEYNQFAFKFEDEKAEARVDHIEWNLTRTSKMSPVACIDPVELDGATIKRVTCFNAQYVKNNRVGPDAYIEIQRSGMVIPDIQKVTVECPNFELPDTCPTCGHKLKWSGVDLICDNPKCAAAIYSDLYQWISKVAAVKGISRAGINDFIDILGVRTVEDIYESCNYIDAKDKIDAAAIGSATRKKYFEMVEWLYGPIDARYFLTGLNLEGIGWNIAEAIASSPAIELIVGGSESSKLDLEEELYKIPGVGWSIVRTISDNYDRIRRIASDVEVITKREPEASSQSIRYFCVTGSLNSGTRVEFCELARSYGWEMADIKKSEVLVTNNPDPTSSKGRKARELGIPILTENEFLKMIKE